jgi:putative redox protein
MNAKIKLIDGIALAGVSNSNHWVTMDGPENFGGHSAGPRPMELVLMGVAGCAAMDVLSILRKKRAELNGFNMEVEAERTEEHPQVFTRIKLNYIFSGKNIQPSDIERSIELTEEKYCGATAMLKGAVEIIHNYRIVESG